MVNARHIIEVIYGVFMDNNLSRILPLLDDNLVVYVSDYEHTGREFHGRSGFIAMMSSLYTICDNLSVNSLEYFKPENQHAQNTLVITGYFEGKLLIDNELAVLPFVHYWHVNDDRVVAVQAFSWDSNNLFSRLRQANKGPNIPSNGHHAGNGTP